MRSSACEKILRIGLGVIAALSLTLGEVCGEISAATGEAGSDCARPECFLPETGRRYNFKVHYPDGDFGTLTMVPKYDEGNGSLNCYNRSYSELYHKFIESRVQYQHLPNGIYRIEILGSGVPELWLPAQLVPGMHWETGSGRHRLVALDAPCPSKLLMNAHCLQVISRYNIMSDIEVESYFAAGFGRILSRIKSSSSSVGFELTGVEAETDASGLPTGLM